MPYPPLPLRSTWFARQHVCQSLTRATPRRSHISTYRYKACALALLVLSPLVLSGCDDVVIRDARSLLFSSFQKSEVWGFVAGFGTTFAAVPDMIAMFRRRSSTGVNPRMAGILAVFQVTWIYYGLLVVSRPVVVWNLIGVAINSSNVAAFAYFLRQEHIRTAHDR